MDMELEEGKEGVPSPGYLHVDYRCDCEYTAVPCRRRERGGGTLLTRAVHGPKRSFRHTLLGLLVSARLLSRPSSAVPAPVASGIPSTSVSFVTLGPPLRA